MRTGNSLWAVVAVFHAALIQGRESPPTPRLNGLHSFRFFFRVAFHMRTDFHVSQQGWRFGELSEFLAQERPLSSV